MSRGLAERRAAWRRGRWAESAAVWRLRLAGYRILARDYRTPMGEVDVIARRGGVLAAVEVKARSDLRLAAEAVTPRQRRRIRRAVDHFVSRHPPLATLAVRFDLMLVAPGAWPRHIAGAWQPD